MCISKKNPAGPPARRSARPRTTPVLTRTSSFPVGKSTKCHQKRGRCSFPTKKAKARTSSRTTKRRFDSVRSRQFPQAVSLPGSQRDRNARVRSRPFPGSMPAKVDDVYPCTDRGEASDGKNLPFAEVDDANSLDQRRRKAGSSPARAQQYKNKCPFAYQVARLATKQDCRLALSEASTAPPADKKTATLSRYSGTTHPWPYAATSCH